jgi:acetyl esterase/lipase
MIVLAMAMLSQTPTEFPVWEGTPPLHMELAAGPKLVDGRLSQVTTPTLTHYPAQGTKTGAAIVICPGGGYGILAIDHEGRQIAEAYNKHGIDAFVLKYRLPADGFTHPAPIWDALQSIRTVRAMANSMELDKSKIGILGFSAGGHLAASASALWDNFPPPGTEETSKLARPSFSILVYPVISFVDTFTHRGSRNNLLGAQATDADARKALSPHLHAKPHTPPAFLAHAKDDTGVKIGHSRVYHEALKKQSVFTVLKEYEVGGHGFGLGAKENDSSAWHGESIKFLKRLGIL